MDSFALGGEESERVEVQVHSNERASVGDEYDDNWVRVTVFLRTGAFSGAYDAAFLTSEFIAFRQSMCSLHQSLSGVARFSTIEGQLDLELTGDGLGHVNLKGVALDSPGDGNRLEFQLALDQGHLSTALRGLDGIACSFPVRAA